MPLADSIPLPAAPRDPPPRSSFGECVCCIRTTDCNTVPCPHGPQTLDPLQPWLRAKLPARAPRWRPLVAPGPNAKGTPWAAQLAKDGAAMPGMSAWSGPISGRPGVCWCLGAALSLSVSLGHFLKGNRLHPIRGQTMCQAPERAGAVCADSIRQPQDCVLSHVPPHPPQVCFFWRPACVC